MATEVKPRSNRLLMVIGIIVGFLAFLLVIVFGGGGKSNGPTGNRNVDVVVATVDIPAGTPISEQLLGVIKYAPDQIPAGTYNSVKKCPAKSTTCTDPLGQFANVAIAKNTPLTANILVATIGAVQVPKKPYLDIPKGQVAISIPAGGELQTVGGYIQPGDKVDILIEPQEKTGSLEDKVTFQNLVIQRIGVAGAAGGQGIATSYVVYVPLADAEYLMYQFGHGTWKYVLRSQDDAADNSNVSTGGVTFSKFSAKYGY